MIFVFKKWEKFCDDLAKCGFISIPAKDVCAENKGYVVLKHDVETDVEKAYAIAKIEHKYGHRGSYYVQAYLMEKQSNIKLLQEMQFWGHEISYHYDVLDSCHGDFEKALGEFKKNCRTFEDHGFPLKTLCQHGNPIIERNGYSSNRDFFRNETVQRLYPNLSDIMVDFKVKHQTDYIYFSDAGRKFNMIFDPLTNDLVKSDDKNIPYNDLDALMRDLVDDASYIISMHPHRWTKSAFVYKSKAICFKMIKSIAKVLVKIPFMKKIMSKYYYLAKKI